MRVLLAAAMLLAGVLWLARATAGIAEREDVVLMASALVSLAPALGALAYEDGGRSGGYGRAGAMSGIGGALLAAVGSVLAVESLVLVGVGLFALGLAAFAIGLTGAEAPWQRVASLLVAMLVGLFGVSLGGGFLFGGAWLALGALLLARRGPFRKAPTH